MRRLAFIALMASACSEPVVGFLLDAGNEGGGGGGDIATGGGSAGGGGGAGGGAMGVGGGQVDLCAGVACTTPQTECFDSPGNCDPGNGQCSYTPKPSDAGCTDDGNPCTDNHCDGEGHCVVDFADGLNCDDGKSCTMADQCSLGQCQGTPSCGASPGECFTVASCGDGGACAFAPKPSGTACTADTSSCTDDVCSGDGGCVHLRRAAGAACTSDGNLCTDDVCDDGGTCGHPANTMACNDGLACTNGDLCSSGACHGANTCTTAPGPCWSSAGSCLGDGGCAYTPLAGTAPCATDNNECSLDHCDGAGTCVHTALDAGCTDDGNACTNDVCVGITCVHPAKAVNTACPDDGNACTFDQCGADAGCTHPPRPMSTPCTDDGIGCTNDVCDSAGSCLHPSNCSTPGVCETLPGVCHANGTCSYTAANVGTGCGTSCPGGPPDQCNQCQCNSIQQCVLQTVTGLCNDGDGLACTQGSCALQGPSWTCVAQSSCTSGNACTGSGCVPCTDLSNNQCGTNLVCDGVNVNAQGSPSVTYPSVCTSTPLGSCSAANATDNSQASNHYQSGQVMVCAKQNGTYAWIARRTSASQGGSGCGAHCTFICSNNIVPPYAAYCDSTNSWNQTLSDATGEGCSAFPGTYLCP